MTPIRLPGCESRHTGDCYGSIEPCSRCGLRRCLTEGTSDLSHLCDDCWHEHRRREAECNACGWLGAPQLSGRCPSCGEKDLAQVTPKATAFVVDARACRAAEAMFVRWLLEGGELVARRKITVADGMNALFPEVYDRRTRAAR